MQKRRRKILSILMAAVIACGMTIPAYALPGDNADEEVIEVVKTTEDETDEQPAATEAPKAEDTKNTVEASDDKYYQEAIGLLSYLGIFAGYEDGSMRPETKITRAEMAAIILRTINTQTYSTYQGGFTDVDSSHWAADVIQTAYESNIISGMGDGTFAPDSSVTYEQAVTMLVRTLNYGDFAENGGGYPTGYIRVADEKDLNKNATGYVGEEIIRQTVAKLVYNTLLADYPRLRNISIKYNTTVNEYETEDGITLLSEKFDVYYVDGIIMATPRKSVDIATSLEDNQILFEDKVMYSELTNADDLVAQYCRVFYYDHDGDYDEVTAVYAVPNDRKTTSITLDADDIDSIFTGYEGAGTYQIKYYKSGSKSTSTLKLIEQPTIVYNDNPFTMANYSKVSPKDENGNLILFDDFITPETGSVKAVDSDNDGKYDILFVESYETSVVKTATISRLQLRYPISVGDVIDLDKTKNEDLNITVTRDGEEIALKNLEEDDVVSIKMNANFGDKTYTGDKFITIEASTDYVDGKLSSVSGEGNNFTVTVDGETFDCVNNETVRSDLKSNIGMKTKFLIDKFGKIAYVKSATTGGLNGNEKYGWVVNLYEKDAPGNAEAQLYTQDAEFITVDLASKVDYWGSDDTVNSSRGEMEIVDFIQNGNNGFTQCSIVEKDGSTKDTVSVKLCKYRLNSKNEINRLYLAVDEKKVGENSGALRLDTKDYRNSKQSSEMFAGKYLIENPLAQFTVPESEADRSDTSIYKYRLAPISEFAKTGDATLGYNCFMADVSDYEPGIAVRLTGGSNKSYSLDSYDTSDDNPVFVITDISTGIDDDDNLIYIIEGICDGEKVTYTTSKNTLVAHVNPEVRKDKSTYNTTTIWKNSMGISLTDVLHEGDICGIKGSAAEVEVILQMVDSTALAEYLTDDDATTGGVPRTQFRRDEMFSASRDRVIFGYVTRTETSPMIRLTMTVDGSTSADDDGDDVTEDGSPQIVVGIKDYNKEVTVVNISKRGKVTVDEEPIDVYSIDRGDYVFVRRFKSDALREVYVVRYE